MVTAIAVGLWLLIVGALVLNPRQRRRLRRRRRAALRSLVDRYGPVTAADRVVVYAGIAALCVVLVLVFHIIVNIPHVPLEVVDAP